MVKYLITSGNSNVGKAALRVLKARGERDVVAGARDPVKSEDGLKKAGATSVVELDFEKPETIEKALKGVERVLVVHGFTANENIIKWAKTVIDLARKPGSSVKAIGKIGVIFADKNSAHPIIQTHGTVLELLTNSGLPSIQIGPTLFMENWMRNKDDILSGVVPGATGGKRVAYVAVEDIAAAAIGALDNADRYHGKHLSITGDLITDGDAIQTISEVSGIPARYDDMSPSEFEQVMLQKGFSPGLAQLQTSWEELKGSGVFETNTSSLLSELLGRKPISFKQWAEAHKNFFCGQGNDEYTMIAYCSSSQ